MDSHTPKFKIRLGMFIAGGLLLFVIAIFLIGKQKNLFNPVYQLSTKFRNVSGLQVGSNIRFSGINVGTVDNITIVNDSTVKVDMLIVKKVQQFIKADCEANVGSSGIIGDKLLIITQGSFNSPIATEGQYISSKEPVELDNIMSGLQVTAYNAQIVSYQLAEIMMKINNGRGTLGRLIQDTVIANNLSNTIVNIKSSSKGLDENMNAVKDNWLLRGYFNKKEAAAQEAKDEAIKKNEKEQKAIEKKKADADKKKLKDQKAIDKKNK
ncbi:MAG: MlaD family protein [Bacteroidota bacterium]